MRKNINKKSVLSWSQQARKVADFQIWQIITADKPVKATSEFFTTCSCSKKITYRAAKRFNRWLKNTTPAYDKHLIDRMEAEHANYVAICLKIKKKKVK